MNQKIILKLSALLPRYKRFIYPRLAVIEQVSCLDTHAHLRQPPQGGDEIASYGDVWGEPWSTRWFLAEVKVSAEAAQQPLYFVHEAGGVEAMAFLNESPLGIVDEYESAMDSDSPSNQEIDAFAVVRNHPVCYLGKSFNQGDVLHLALEAYAGHPKVGCHPNELSREEAEQPDRFQFRFKGLFLHGYDALAADLFYGLRTILQLADALDPQSLRRARCLNALSRIYEVLPQLPSEVTDAQRHKSMQQALQIIEPVLLKKGQDAAPEFSIVGHSHMDTAWLWTIDETIRKCARTYANAASLLDRYPEYRFFQSSPYHLEMMREHYPDVYQHVIKHAKEGRYEVNGGGYIEPDCNIPGGEALVRNFLIGNQSLSEMGLPPSDVFWLPDTFGYSASLPQILRQCRIRAFFTSKLSWNDTNAFPLDTFNWVGIDGSAVLTHLTTVHTQPDIKQVAKEWDAVKDKHLQDFKLLPFGFGDGGGGPSEDSLEYVRRATDVEGCPRMQYSGVSEFVEKLETKREKWPQWVGELYLELHRGTLTTIHDIKRGNRKAEQAFQETEFLASLAWLQDAPYPNEQLAKLWRKFLINQFHDILPGTSIPEVHDRAIQELSEVHAELQQLTHDTLSLEENKAALTVANSLSWTREGWAALPADMEHLNALQTVAHVDGSHSHLIQLRDIKPLSVQKLSLNEQLSEAPDEPAFRFSKNSLETPHAFIEFDEAGGISRYFHRGSERELIAEGQSWNAFFIGEDIPQMWDNWDIDADQHLVMKRETRMITREVCSDGRAQFRIRQTLRLGEDSTITQVMVFHADSPQVDFETLIDWKECHKLLKVAFPTTIQTIHVRNEIQFGHVLRNTHDNLNTDQAQFEVSQQKWSDLSENRFGITLLNDCKYGLGVRDGEYRLTLMKSGGHPDHRGDHGKHRMNYAILPHEGGFSTENVVRPAYEFNQPLRLLTGSSHMQCECLAEVDAPNVIIETVKRSEDGESLILRLYECEGSGTWAKLRGSESYTVHQTNLLEETMAELSATPTQDLKLYFKPFEIVTLSLRTS